MCREKRKGLDVVNTVKYPHYYVKKNNLQNEKGWVGKATTSYTEGQSS